MVRKYVVYYRVVDGVLSGHDPRTFLGVLYCTRSRSLINVKSNPLLLTCVYEYRFPLRTWYTYLSVSLDLVSPGCPLSRHGIFVRLQLLISTITSSLVWSNLWPSERRVHRDQGPVDPDDQDKTPSSRPFFPVSLPLPRPFRVSHPYPVKKWVSYIFILGLTSTETSGSLLSLDNF